MKIIEYGHIKPKEVKCKYCGAILEYVPTDVNVFEDLYILVCPVCNCAIVMDDNGNRLTKN